MIEVILTLLGLSFLFAYLYSKSPESSTVSGFAFRLLFLGMCLWTSYLLVWTTFNTNTTIRIDKYDAYGNLTGYEIHTTALSEPIKNTLVGYLDVMTWIPYVVLALIMVFFIYNSFISILRKRE